MPKFNELALKILKDRYLWRDDQGTITETPEELLRRVAKHIASVEEEGKRAYWEEEFYNIMENLDFLPNSPTLMNSGRQAPHGQLAACFVVDVEDSMQGICEALRQQMLIHKTGGGTGFNFSKLRAKNSTVGSTNGKASGPVSFMRLFDLSTDVVQQGGMRRGANMGILEADHADIEEFIKCKDEDGVIANFNLSVGVSDQFMLNARDKCFSKEAELLHLIAEQAWKTGDPGLVFMDAINADNPTPELGKITATNPCVTGETRILTDKGYRVIADCVGEKVKVWNGTCFSEVEPKVTGEHCEVMDITFSDGSELTCTPYHKFFVQKKYSRDGHAERKEAQRLTIGDKLVKTAYPVIEPSRICSEADAMMYVNGFFTGDGCESGGRQTLRLYGVKRALLSHLTPVESSHGSITRDPINIDLSHVAGLRPKFWIPAEHTVANRLAWFSGLVDADGHRNSKEGSLVVTSINREFLLEVRLMLNTLGIAASVLPLKDEGMKLLPDGRGSVKEYHIKKSYRLCISAASVVQLKRLGFETKRVDLSDIAPNRNAGRFVKVVKIERTGKMADKVYCFNEPLEHTGVFNGILTGNCGESPLLGGESCNLGSIKLANMVDKRGNIEWARLVDVVRTAVRFLDNVVEVGQYPIPEIERAVKRTRKIGLGIMGWADFLYKLKIRYGSKESFSYAETVMDTIRTTAHEYSRWLGTLKGIPEACRELKRRNATLTCIAPTGTLALLAGCSSGIEPVFSLRHTRRISTVQSDKVEEIEIFHPIYEKALKDFSIADGEIERIFVTAYSIPWKEQIEMQALFQEYTDLAVSKTVNLPAEATVEDIFDCYVYAWNRRCKGTTIYRNGSKGTQVLTITEEALPEPKCSTC